MSGLDGNPCVPEQSFSTSNRYEKASHRAWAEMSGRMRTPVKGATIKGNSLGNQLRREDMLPPFSMFYSLVMGFLAFASLMPQFGKTRGGAKFPGFGLLV